MRNFLIGIILAGSVVGCSSNVASPMVEAEFKGPSVEKPETTGYVYKRCVHCGGDGRIFSGKCTSCNGTGRIRIWK